MGRGRLPRLGCRLAGPPLAATDGRPIVLLHPGSAYQGEPLPLLAALDRLAADGVDLDRLCFHFVGYLHPQDQAAIDASAHSRLFRRDPVRVPHDQALRMMREAHVLLLLLLRKGPDASSGKVFEYMVAGRPVLSIGAGVGSRLVEETGVGVGVAPEDVERLADLLRQIAVDYAGFAAMYHRPNRAVIYNYNRQALTGKLADVLGQAVRRP